MRNRIIAAAVVALGLVAVPSFVQAGERAEDRTVTRETRTVTREVRPVERDTHVVVRDEHVQREVRPVIRDEHRDVRVDEHVIVDRGHDRYWNHDRVDYIPAPVVVTTPVVVAPCTDTAIGITSVPPAVLNAAAQRTGGAPIVGVDFVQNAGGTFYDVHVTGAYNTIQTLRFGINGGFFGNL